MKYHLKCWIALYEIHKSQSFSIDKAQTNNSYLIYSYQRIK